jgi:hypothetical protein
MLEPGNEGIESGKGHVCRNPRYRNKDLASTNLAKPFPNLSYLVFLQHGFYVKLGVVVNH